MFTSHGQRAPWHQICPNGALGYCIRHLLWAGEKTSCWCGALELLESVETAKDVLRLSQ
jgi:hypothetical protein